MDLQTNSRILSDREKACLRLSAHGFTSKEIASDLNISERTVNGHIVRATQKLGARSRCHAAVIALTRRLIHL